MGLQKRKPIHSDAIRAAANGEPCTLCGTNDGTTVFCHLNYQWAGKGIGQKADDFGFFGCGKCHAEYDQYKKSLIDYLEILRACYRTWRRLIEKGVVCIKDFEINDF